MDTRNAQCCEKVFSGGGYSIGGIYLQCERIAKQDGYCTQHHPETIAARQKEKWARIARKNSRRDRIGRR